MLCVDSSTTVRYIRNGLPNLMLVSVLLSLVLFESVILCVDMQMGEQVVRVRRDYDELMEEK